MPITIFHGEQVVASRAALTMMLDEARAARIRVDSYEAKQIKLGTIEQIIASDDLFSQKRLVVIEALHSELRAGKKRDQLIEMLKGAVAGNQLLTPDQGLELVFWEKTTLTATALKKFPNATIKLFKPPYLIWEFLDQLQPQVAAAQLVKYHDLFESGFYLLAMIERQIRLLIQVKTGATAKIAPFQLSKLQNQAKKWTLKQLLDYHHALLELEIRQKTGKSYLPLERDLILLCYNQN